MTNFNNRKALRKERKVPISKSFIYAKTFGVNISNHNSGTWKIFPDGTKIWFVKIKSKNAYSIGLIFSEYNNLSFSS